MRLYICSHLIAGDQYNQMAFEFADIFFGSHQKKKKYQTLSIETLQKL